MINITDSNNINTYLCYHHNTNTNTTSTNTNTNTNNIT